MLNLLLKELVKWGNKKNQPYLHSLYMAMLSSVYYGLLRVGKIAKGHHTILVENMYLASNKRKMLFILRSSKTQHTGCHPQQIKITSSPPQTTEKSHNKSTHFCPYEILCDFIAKRPHAISDVEQFFVFSDRSPVSAEQIRRILHMLINRLGLQSHLYNVQSLRIGRCVDLLNWGVSVETIKKLGRWKSSAVFKYLKE